ncbi:SDR family NAD(P)-dependent oxidoreductase [Aspergillus vadensis CBS 113365]|uniref:Short chain dehydrogenase/reductase family n=1 Tax=Aspergillus vadensis (strain CBS 113365 / IMI 142717 / IBT 24658) TaxID=1448311 RepID=A0A319BIK3_ASPVC|nr:short chain dehydrogenase/reductase family [Aspergillus vadensis CBS 113365]PYH72014.1 short chain dehydrogenase/reductase family [Aspergillus vadensis CBS 113365]
MLQRQFLRAVLRPTHAIRTSNTIRPAIYNTGTYLNPTPLYSTTQQHHFSHTTTRPQSNLHKMASASNENFKLENLFGVKGKVALITGGGSGIGLMATQALATNGAKVYITGRTQEKLDRVASLYNKNISGEIIPIVSDITSKESISKLVKEIESRESHLSILINNAGISSSTDNTEPSDATELKKSLFDDATPMSEWEDTYRTNVMQLYFTTTAFLPLLQKGSEREKGWSSTVVNITSISGIVKVSQHHFAYNASKAAAIHLTKMLAHEVADSGLRIRVNNIAPGVFPSEMTAGESDEKQKSQLAKEKYEGKVPAARPGKDEDMASAVLFVSTNQYLNGQTVVVDGGYVLAAGTV